MEQLTIGEIAQRAGVATSTIRYYEKIGLLPAAPRVNTKRRYNSAILQKLGVIRLAQQLGFTIAEIQILLHDFPVDTVPSKRWQALAGKKIAELEERMTQIQEMKLMLEQTQHCSCETLEDCAGENMQERSSGSITLGCQGQEACGNAN